MQKMQDKARPVPGLFVSWEQALAHLSQKSEVLARLAQRYRARPEAPLGLAGGTFMALCAQQISNKAFETVRGRIFNRLLVTNWTDAASALMQLHVNQRVHTLNQCGVNLRKSKALLEVFSYLESRTWTQEYFLALSNEQAQSELTKIYGIGPWSAQMILIFGLDRPDVWPQADYGIRTALSRVVFPYKRADAPLPKALPDTVQLLVSSWAPYRSAAALLLWRSLENGSSDKTVDPI